MSKTNWILKICIKIRKNWHDIVTLGIIPTASVGIFIASIINLAINPYFSGTSNGDKPVISHEQHESISVQGITIESPTISIINPHTKATTQPVQLSETQPGENKP